MNDEQKIKNKIAKIIAENKLPKEIKEKLNSIYKDYEDSSRQCCSSLMRLNENELTNIIAYIKKDKEEMKEFINSIARK